MKILTDSTKIKRRALLGMIPAAAAVTATPALAYQMPITETPEPDLPHWWRKLTGETAATDPDVFHPWRDTVLTRELAVKVEELRELLLLMGAPVDVDTITDFRLHWSEGGVPQNVIAVGRSGAHGEGLHVLQPEFGWVDQSAKIGEAV